MEKNKNNDNRNQDKTDNKSNQKTTQDFNKKETDPNNPIANKDKQKGTITNQDKSITNKTQSKPGFENNKQHEQETSDKRKTSDSSTKQNEIKSTNLNTTK